MCDIACHNGFLLVFFLNEVQFLFGCGMGLTQTFGKLFGAKESAEIDGLITSGNHIQMKSARWQEWQTANSFVCLHLHHDSHRSGNTYDKNHRKRKIL